MYLYLGLILVFHSCYSLSEFRKLKIKYTGTHYIPMDITIEFSLGIILVLLYVTTLFKNLKNIKIEEKSDCNYSNSMNSKLLDLKGNRKYFLNSFFMKKYESLLSCFK